MSQENVELVRRLIQAFNDRDYPAAELIYSEDAVLNLIGGFADLTGAQFRGREAVLKWLTDWVETLDPRAQIASVRPVSDDQVFAILNIAATGAASGADTALRTGNVYSVRNGRISAHDAYYDVNEALKAMGVNEQAVSQETVEIVRTFFEAWNARDMDAIRELYDSDAVVCPPEGWPEPGPFVGREAVMSQFQQMRELWEADAGVALSDFITADDRVAVRTAWHGKGRGPESTMEFTIVFTVHNGRIVHQETYWNYAETLEMLGMAE